LLHFLKGKEALNETKKLLFKILLTFEVEKVIREVILMSSGKFGIGLNFIRMT
jgi:hypothetical protein